MWRRNYESWRAIKSDHVMLSAAKNLCPLSEILCCTQHDMIGPILVVKNHNCTATQQDEAKLC